MKRIHPFLLCVPIFLLIFGCSDCNDCLDLQQKNILVQDADGNDLLFGANAIFDPATVTINSGGKTPRSLFVDEETQTLLFALEPDQTNYTLQLDDNTVATLVFELGERKSERCCGNQIYSTSTQANGTVIDNSDTITIVN